MYCAKCGKENPDDAQLCGSCGCALKGSDTVKPKTQARTSKLAVLSLVLGVLSLPFFVLTGLPALVVGVVSIVRIAGSRGALKGMSVALAGIIVSILMMSVFAVLWCVDAPPIPNDYTIADLRSAPAQYAESFEILKILIDEDYNLPGAPAICLAEEDVDMSAKICTVIREGTPAEISKILEHYAKDIERAWDGMKEPRDVIRRLDTFAEMADLTELNTNLKIMRVSNLIELARFYQVYAHLKIEQRDIQAFTAELIELDSVCRKLSVNARMLVPKLVYLICINENILTANAIVNDQRISMSRVELLAEHFIPLTDEQTSLRNSILSEYLLMRSMFSEVSEESAAEKILPLKKNSTLRLFRNFYDDWMDADEGRQNIAKAKLSVWPDIYPFKEPAMSLANYDRLSLLYRWYNPCINIINIIRPSYKTIKSRKNSIIRIQIQDDLLQIVLNRRLGKEIDLKARAYGDKYIVDVENGKIFSPGPDGKLNTRDDIKLSINPELLGYGTSR